jgi:copper(I)-binding protein
MRKKGSFFLVVLLLPLLAACGMGGPARIEVGDASVLEARISPLVAGDTRFACICDTDTATGDTMTPVFLSIRNRGGEADRLLKVETEGAVLVSLRKVSDPQDIFGAAPVDTVEIPPHARVVFGDGPYAMLLTGLRGDLVPGQTLALTLHFEQSGPLAVEAAITPRE